MYNKECYKIFLEKKVIKMAQGKDYTSFIVEDRRRWSHFLLE